MTRMRKGTCYTPPMPPQRAPDSQQNSHDFSRLCDHRAARRPAQKWFVQPISPTAQYPITAREASSPTHQLPQYSNAIALSTLNHPTASADCSTSNSCIKQALPGTGARPMNCLLARRTAAPQLPGSRSRHRPQLCTAAATADLSRGPLREEGSRGGEGERQRLSTGSRV